MFVAIICISWMEFQVMVASEFWRSKTSVLKKKWTIKNLKKKKLEITHGKEQMAQKLAKLMTIRFYALMWHGMTLGADGSFLPLYA